MKNMPKNHKWYPYIKITDKKHESGYDCFECGYVNSENERIVIATECDHIYNWSFTEHVENLNMDTKNGIIRFYSSTDRYGIKWSYDYGLCSMSLKNGWYEPNPTP